MKNLRYAASVVVVLASMVFVGCGIGGQSHQVGENATAENGAVENAAPEKSATGNDAADDAAALRANPKNAEPKQAAPKKAVPDSPQFAIPGGGLTLENSILSVSVPKGWTPNKSPVPEKYLTMFSSVKGYQPVSVTLHFGIMHSEYDHFELAKGVYERKSNIDSERMQKVAGHDALRLEMTQIDTDDEGNLNGSIVVIIMLDDSILTISGNGSTDAVDAIKDQFEEIIDSIKLK